MSRRQREALVVEIYAWLFIVGGLAYLTVALWAAVQVTKVIHQPLPSSSALSAKPQPRWSPLIPRREEEPEQDEDELATPGLYAANHSHTNQP